MRWTSIAGLRSLRADRDETATADDDGIDAILEHAAPVVPPIADDRAQRVFRAALAASGARERTLGNRWRLAQAVAACLIVGATYQAFRQPDAAIDPGAPSSGDRQIETAVNPAVVPVGMHAPLRRIAGSVTTNAGRTVSVATPPHQRLIARISMRRHGAGMPFGTSNRELRNKPAGHPPQAQLARILVVTATRPDISVGIRKAPADVEGYARAAACAPLESGSGAIRECTVAGVPDAVSSSTYSLAAATPLEQGAYLSVSVVHPNGETIVEKGTIP